MTLKEIAIASKEDKKIKEVKLALQTDDWDALKNSRYKIIKEQLCICNNVLLRNTRIIIPEALQRKTLMLAHEGHPGIVAVKQRLRSKVWWEGIDKDAEKFVKSCKGCQLVQRPIEPPPVKRKQLPEKAWEIIAIELMGPLPTGEYLLVTTDYYSRFVEVAILKRISAKEIQEELFELFARHGLPRTIVCDNGRQFTDEGLKDWLNSYGAKVAHVAPYWPQANGEVERQNRSILKRLKIAYAQKKNWRNELLTFLMMYRSTPHSVTGVTPAELLFNRKLRTKIPEIDNSSEFVEEEIRERDKWLKEKGKQYYDKANRAKECELGQGDRVLIRAPKENKLSPNFSPKEYKVIDRKGNSVTLESEEGRKYKRNLTQVRKVIDLESEESENEEEEVVSEEKERVGDDQSRTESDKNEKVVVRRSQRERKPPERYGDYRAHSLNVMVIKCKRLKL